MNGFDVLEAFRKNHALAATPVVMLTGYLDEQLESVLRALGAADCLAKPCSIDTLIARLGQALSRSRRTLPPEALEEPPPTERSRKER
jgi:DNA-binding response OmpR family regulator